MTHMSNLIGFWNSKSAEAEVITRPKPRPEAIKTRKWESSIVSNPAQSLSGCDGYGHRKVKDLPLDRAGERGKISGKTVPALLGKVVSEKPQHWDSAGKESDKNTAKECLPEKRTGLDLKNGHQATSSNTVSPAQPRADKPVSPFAKFKQMENDQASSKYGSCSSPPSPIAPRMTNLSRNSSLPSSPRPTITHAQLSAPGTVAARSGSGAKEIILGWVQQTLKDYPIPMTNFSSCWSNGLAFCALIHAFYPDSFDWNSLKAENREYNFSLGFEAAEVLAGISPLLEVEDMVRYDRPDWKCVFCYVQSFYRRFRNVSNPTVAHVITIPAHTQEDKQNDKTVITSPLATTTNTTTDPSSPILVRESSPPKIVTESHSSILVSSLQHDANTSSQPSEDQTPTINIKSNLNPTITGKTGTRSKSTSEQPTVVDKAIQERKYSFSHPLTTDTTHLVSFNTRQ